MGVGIEYQQKNSPGFVPATGSSGLGWTHEEIPEDAVVLRAIIVLRRSPSSINHPRGDA